LRWLRSEEDHVSAATIDELVIADEPDRWAALGFAVADGCCRLGTVRLVLGGERSGGGIVGWSVRGIESTKLDGLPTTRSERPRSSAAPAQPNGVIAIDHVVVISPMLDRSVRALRAAGLDLRRLREQPTPAGAPRQAFFRLGEEILEVVQEPEDVVQRSDGSDRPARFWGLALSTDDLEHTVAVLGEHAGPIRPAVQPGRQIATVRRSAALAVPIALMSSAERPRMS
jgi:hypothetical protein